jgi:conjugative transfer region protein (TIGR03750 family)
MSNEADSAARQADQQGESTRFRAPVTDRVNVEPAIMRGMTVTEARLIALVTFPICLLLGVILLMITGFWQFILMLGMVGPLVALWVGSGYLQKIKRGRPDGYYTQAIHLWMAKRGLTTNQFLSHNGQWDLGRSMDFALDHPFEIEEAKTKQTIDPERTTP